MSLVCLKEVDIPVYLRKSEFYQSLSLDVDEEISVPADCIKQDETVKNVDQLRCLLSTLRFCGAPDCPASVICYILTDNDRECKVSVASEFQTELQYLATLVELTKCSFDARLLLAIQQDNIAAVDILCGAGFLPDAKCFEMACTSGHLESLRCISDKCDVKWLWRDTLNVIIAKGFLHVLLFLQEHGNDIVHRNVANTAAEHGQIEVLKFYIELTNRIVSTDRIACNAARNGHLECFAYAYEHGLHPRHYDAQGVIHDACEFGHLQILKYLYDRGVHIDDFSSYLAAREGHLAVLQFIHEHGGELDDIDCVQAAINRHLHCVHFLCEIGVPLHPYIFPVTATSGHVHCLSYLLANGCEADPSVAADVIHEAVGCGRLQILQFLHEYGFPLDHTLCEAALQNGHLDCLKYLHEHGVPLHLANTEEAAAQGHTECLVYAHEHGASWGAKTCENAALYGQLGCLKYAYEHVCPWDISTYKFCPGFYVQRSDEFVTYVAKQKAKFDEISADADILTARTPCACLIM